MSTLSGIASKGDKSKAKFKTIDINNVYKGTSVAPQKTAGKLVCDVYRLIIFHSPFIILHSFYVVGWDIEMTLDCKSSC